MAASHSVSGDRSVEPTAPSTRCCVSRASRQRPDSAARSRNPRSAPRWSRRLCKICRKCVAASSVRPKRRASCARWSSSTVGESSASARRPTPTLKKLLRLQPRARRERTETGDVTGAGSPGSDREQARRRGARLARGHPLLFLDHPLAVDAVTRERQGLEPFLGNRLVAPLARPEGAIVQLLEGREDIAEDPTVAVAELEAQLAGVRRIGLVAQVLDRVVLRVLSVQSGPADLLGQLPLLFDKALLEVCEAVLAHRGLLPYDDRAQPSNQR